MAKRFRPTWRQVVGSICALAAVAMTVVAGLVGPAKAAAIVALAVVAGMFQLAAAWVFRGYGKADPTLASAAVRRLLKLANRAGLATKRVEYCFENNLTKTDMHVEMGILSTELSWIEDGLVESIEDWNLFHPIVVDGIKKSLEEARKKEVK